MAEKKLVHDHVMRLDNSIAVLSLIEDQMQQECSGVGGRFNHSSWWLAMQLARNEIESATNDLRNL